MFLGFRFGNFFLGESSPETTGKFGHVDPPVFLDLQQVAFWVQNTTALNGKMRSQNGSLKRKPKGNFASLHIIQMGI